jgi:hypothetical protein
MDGAPPAVIAGGTNHSHISPYILLYYIVINELNEIPPKIVASNFKRPWIASGKAGILKMTYRQTIS